MGTTAVGYRPGLKILICGNMGNWIVLSRKTATQLTYSPLFISDVDASAWIRQKRQNDGFVRSFGLMGVYVKAPCSPETICMSEYKKPRCLLKQDSFLISDCGLGSNMRQRTGTVCFALSNDVFIRLGICRIEIVDHNNQFARLRLDKILHQRAHNFNRLNL